MPSGICKAQHIQKSIRSRRPFFSCIDSAKSGCLKVRYVARWRQQASLVPAPALAGLAHGQPHIQGVRPREMCTAYTTASQQHPPPPLAHCALIVKHPHSDDGVAGQPVIHGRLHVGEFWVEGMLCPRDMTGPTLSRNLHQWVGQVIGLESYCYTYTAPHK